MVSDRRDGADGTDDVTAPPAIDRALMHTYPSRR
jgi:hypothetical protein